MEKLKVGLEVSHLVLELEVAVGDEDAEEGAAQAQQGHQQDLVPLGERAERFYGDIRFKSSIQSNEHKYFRGGWEMCPPYTSPYP